MTTGDSPNAQAAWRFPLAFQCVAPLVVLAGSHKIPYSPRWLLSQGRKAEALQVVKNLHYTPRDPEHIHAREEYYLMARQFEQDAQLTHGFMQMFRTKPNRKRSLISFLLMWGDQFLGIFVMVGEPSSNSGSELSKWSRVCEMKQTRAAPERMG